LSKIRIKPASKTLISVKTRLTMPEQENFALHKFINIKAPTPITTATTTRIEYNSKASIRHLLLRNIKKKKNKKLI
jgi:CxxC motif-containing protein